METGLGKKKRFPGISERVNFDHEARAWKVEKNWTTTGNRVKKRRKLRSRIDGFTKLTISNND